LSGIFRSITRRYDDIEAATSVAKLLELVDHRVLL